MIRWMRTVALLALAVWVTPYPASAQERGVETADLPRHISAEIIDFFNRPSTIRFRGRAEIPEGSVIEGDVAALGGPFVVAGEIDGDLVVVNGLLRVEPGGHITGDVTVVGGRVQAGPEAVGGQLTVYDEALRYRHKGSRLVAEERRRRSAAVADTLEYRKAYTRSRISVRTERSYNRVEGLPVMVGPVIETPGDNRVRVDAMAIWRSDSGLRIDRDEMGYYLRAEYRRGRHTRLTLGGTVHSVITPIESWGLTDIESSSATILLHKDYRDYFEREGISAYANLDLPRAGLTLRGEYRDEDHHFVPVGNPWTLKDNDTAWRPQPLVAEGNLRSLAGEVVFDDRNDPGDPTDGWLIRAGGTAGLGGSLSLPGFRDPEPLPPDVASAPRPVNADFRSGFLDVRRYNRLGPSTDLRLRTVVGGPLDGKPLPPQFQHALGGVGSLPGYSTLSLDCGARAARYSVFRGSAGAPERLPTFAGYGCDGFALFQAEFRGRLTFDLNPGPDEDEEWDEKWDWYPAIDFSPSWSIFFDAGRGWSASEPGDPGYLGPDTETLMDVGTGFFLGDLGLYWAFPLKGPDKGVNFFLRIRHRF